MAKPRDHPATCPANPKLGSALDSIAEAGAQSQAHLECHVDYTFTQLMYLMYVALDLRYAVGPVVFSDTERREHCDLSARRKRAGWLVSVT